MTVVLDASALLAFLHNEPGGDIVRDHLGKSIISTVNWCEVIQKCVERGVDTVGMAENFATLGVRILPYTITQAEIAGQLWLETRPLGLSLGDRSCLALGLEKKLPVLTADKAWQSFNKGLEIRFIR